MKDYLEASKDAFLNSFISFSNSNVAKVKKVIDEHIEAK